MKIALKHLLDRLDAIRKAHPEIRDADVRETLAAAIYHSFILQVPGCSLPESLDLHSAEGNAAVRIALAEFLDASVASGAWTPEQRFAAFQDATIESDAGNCYDKYFGYARNYDHLVELMSRTSTARAAAPKAVAAWWQFWKHSHPRTS